MILANYSFLPGRNFLKVTMIDKHLKKAGVPSGQNIIMTKIVITKLSIGLNFFYLTQIK